MEREEKIIKKYLEEKFSANRPNRGESCPNQQTLLDYVTDNLGQSRRQDIEKHLAKCGFCLNQISTAYNALKKSKQKSFPPLPENILNKTKSYLGIKEDKQKKPLKKIARKRLLLAATIIFFILSFLIPKYFLQFLVGALILGIRWSFESESGKTLIMVLDSWRRHSHDKDDQISNRLKNHFKK